MILSMKYCGYDLFSIEIPDQTEAIELELQEFPYMDQNSGEIYEIQIPVPKNIILKGDAIPLETADSSAPLSRPAEGERII